MTPEVSRLVFIPNLIFCCKLKSQRHRHSEDCVSTDVGTSHIDVPFAFLTKELYFPQVPVCIPQPSSGGLGKGG